MLKNHSTFSVVRTTGSYSNLLAPRGTDRRVPSINVSDEHAGLRPATVRGDFRLRNVSFAYPLAPGVDVLRRVELCIPGGKVTALVGGSLGCSSLTRCSNSG